MRDQFYALVANVQTGVNLNPRCEGKCPGKEAVQTVVDALGFYALWACLAGAIISLAIAGVAHKMGSSRYESAGKVGFIVSAAAAFGIGVAPDLINWALALGKRA